MKLIWKLTAALEGDSYFQGNFQITPGHYPIFDMNGIHRREWLVNIQIENFAVDGSFFVHVFLGDFNPIPENWTQDMNLVGTHSVFSPAIGKTGCQNCIKDHQNNALVSGGISLTIRLLEKFKDIEPPTIEPYLKENLHWRVQNVSVQPNFRQAVTDIFEVEWEVGQVRGHCFPCRYSVEHHCRVS